MAGMLSYSVSPDVDLNVFNPFLELYLKVDPSLWSENAYSGQYFAAVAGYNNAYTYANNASIREQAFNWCTVDGYNCTIMSINMGDAMNRAVTSYYHELVTGSCTNTMAFSSSAFDNVDNTPPDDLIQDYYDCAPSPASAFLDSLGVANGNLAAAAPFVVLFFINLYVFIVAMRGGKVKQTYSRAERDDALQGFALQLLMMRDERIKVSRRTHQLPIERTSTVDKGINPGANNLGASDVSVLHLLTQELMANAYLDPYFNSNERETRSSLAAKKAERARVTEATNTNPMLGSGPGRASVSVASARESASTRGSAAGKASTEVEMSAFKKHAKQLILNDCDVVALSRSNTHSNMENLLNAIIVYIKQSEQTTASIVAVQAPSVHFNFSSVSTNLQKLMPLLDALKVMMLTTMSDSAEFSFWDVAPLTAVLQHFPLPLQELHERFLSYDGGDSAVDLAAFKSSYVQFLAKLHELLQTHICMHFTTSLEEIAVKHADSAFYYIGNRCHVLSSHQRSSASDLKAATYSLSDIIKMYDNARNHSAYQSRGL
jgi:hypothetical protein